MLPLACYTPAMSTCGQLKSNNRKCRKAAGWGTNHPGGGKCRLHESIPKTITQGLPSVESIKALAVSFKTDKDPFDLREEIAITRAGIAETLNQIDDTHDLTRHAKSLNMLLNTVGKLVQRLHEIEVGRRYVVSVDQVRRSLSQISVIVTEAIPDPAMRASVAQRINGLQVAGMDAPKQVTSLSDTEHEVLSLVSGHQDS